MNGSHPRHHNPTGYDRQIEIAAKKLMPVDSQVFKRVKGFTCWPNYQESYDFDNRHTMLSFAWEDEGNDHRKVFLEERIKYAVARSAPN